jgi:hypothetical protein
MQSFGRIPFGSARAIYVDVQEGLFSNRITVCAVLAAAGFGPQASERMGGELYCTVSKAKVRPLVSVLLDCRKIWMVCDSHWGLIPR